VRQAQIFKWSDLGTVSISERPEETQMFRDFADAVDRSPAMRWQ
jgi:hypothetical protein